MNQLRRRRGDIISTLMADSRVSTRYAFALRNAGATEKCSEFTEAATLLAAVAERLGESGDPDSYDYTEEELELVRDSLLYAVSVHDLFVAELLSRQPSEQPS